MLKVYVAGAYSADNVMDVLKNISIGIKASADLLEQGFAPFCPWLDHQFALQNPNINKQLFYNFSLEWLKVSDVIYVLPNSKKSEGTKKEIEVANNLGIPVVLSIKELNKLK